MKNSKNEGRTILRKTISYLYSKICRTLFSARITDYSNSYRIYKTESLKDLLKTKRNFDTIDKDLLLMQEAGINTIRVYSPIDDLGILNKIDEEIYELKDALKVNNKKIIEEELGDLFFTIINLLFFNPIFDYWVIR